MAKVQNRIKRFAVKVVKNRPGEENRGGVPDGVETINGKIMLPMILHRTYHDPVLLPQVTEGLNLKAGGKYIDATLGGGGFTKVILNRGGKVLGIDLDQDAIEFTRQKFKDQENLTLKQGNFGNLKDIAKEEGFESVDGIIFDLGMSTNQLANSGRGFTYKGNEPLDMRMDKKSEISAREIINHYSYSKLYEIFTKYAEELHSGVIAEAIIRARSIRTIETTEDLVKILRSVVAKIKIRSNSENVERESRDAITRIFQALRITTNDEIGNLTRGLNSAIGLLGKSGRICVLSYHSLEDREVKKIFRDTAGQNLLKILTKSPVRAGYLEIRDNPKARAAKLRIAEKILK